MNANQPLHEAFKEVDDKLYEFQNYLHENLGASVDCMYTIRMSLVAKAAELQSRAKKIVAKVEKISREAERAKI